MKNKLNMRWTLVLLLTPLAAITAGPLEAADLNLLGSNGPPVDFHGFASQGFLASTSYNYLGDTTRGSFKFTEAGLNATVDPLPRTRISAQAFTFDVGQAGDYDVVLDYAQVQYTFAEWLGVRAGRIRRPEGIFNEVQDLDMAYPWVVVPQGVCNSRWRDMYLSVDGGELFGTIPMKTAGSLSYELYYGFQRPQLDGGFAIQKENLPPDLKVAWINSPLLGGGQLWWNAPWNGLRAGVALNVDQDLTFVNVEGRRSDGSPFTQRYSLEYFWKSWTFQAEYFTSRVLYQNTGGGAPDSVKLIDPDGWFASATYRFNKWFETGAYYTEYYPDKHDRNGAALAVHSDGYQKDAALALEFDAASWWTFKIEGHHINGTGQLFDNTDNPARGGNGWWMLGVKTTLSF
jgi:hypothetical protein